MAKRGPKPGSEAAKRGGRALRDKYGSEHLAAMGKRGGETVRERADPDYFAALGRKGGAATLERHGPAHFSRAGRQGGLAGHRSEPKKGEREAGAERSADPGSGGGGAPPWPGAPPARPERPRRSGGDAMPGEHPVGPGADEVRIVEVDDGDPAPVNALLRGGWRLLAYGVGERRGPAADGQVTSGARCTFILGRRAEQVPAAEDGPAGGAASAAACRPRPMPLKSVTKGALRPEIAKLLERDHQPSREGRPDAASPGGDH